MNFQVATHEDFGSVFQQVKIHLVAGEVAPALLQTEKADYTINFADSGQLNGKEIRVLWTRETYEGLVTDSLTGVVSNDNGKWAVLVNGKSVELHFSESTDNALYVDSDSLLSLF